MVKEEIYKIIRNLADEGKSMIVVSSELDELLRICDNIIVMFDGKEVMTSSKKTLIRQNFISICYGEERIMRKEPMKIGDLLKNITYWYC